MKKRYISPGQIFTRLKVVELSEKKRYGSSTRNFWKCQCECGNFTKVCTNDLYNGNSKSCGCLKIEISTHRIKNAQKSRHLPFGESSKRSMFNAYRAAAKKKGRDFELTIEDFHSFAQQNCAYCGTEPRNEYTHQENSNGFYRSNGIDRINSSRGYVKGNMVPCCKICNRMKMDLGESVFFEHVSKIYHFRGLK